MSKHDLTIGSVRGHLIRLAVPMIWGILAIMSVNLVDTFFVGQLGTAELAAMSFTFPVVMILSSLAFGVGTGASSLISRSIGSKDVALVRSYATQSIIIALIMALLVAVAGLFSIDPLFTLLGADPALLPLIHEYMEVWYMGSFLLVVPMVGNAAIRASGDTRLPSLVMIVVAVSNMILDPIFIFGWFGLPPMGLFGAALASVIAFSVAFVVSLYVLISRLHFLSWQACTQRVWPVRRAILRLAIPAAGTNLAAPFSTALTTWLVAGYGSEAVAGYGVVSRIESMCLIMLFAFASIIGPFTGQNIGAKHYDRMRVGITLGFKFSLVLGALVTALLWLITPWLTGLFSDDPQTLAAANLYLYIVPITYGLLGLVVISSSVANGVGQPLPALVMTLFRLVLIYLPLAWALSAWLGLGGLFAATAFSNLLVGTGAWLWCRRKWQTGAVMLRPPFRECAVISQT